LTDVTSVAKRSEELPDVWYHQLRLLPERKMAAMGQLAMVNKILTALQ
jgi:hypothetical protein